MKNLKVIYEIIKPTRKYMIAIAVISLIGSAEMLIFPLISRNLINNAVDLVSNKITYQQSLASFLVLILFFGAVGLITGINNTAQTYFQTRFSALFEQLLRIKLFSHLSSLSMEFFENEKIGQVTNKISRGISRSSNLLQTLSNWLLSQLINYLAVLVIFFFLNVWIGITCLLISVIFIIVSYFMTQKLKPLHKIINKKHDMVIGKQLEVLSNMQVVKSFAMEKAEVRNLSQKYDKLVELYYNRAGKRLRFSFVRNILASGLTVTSLAISGYAVLRGKMTPGDIFLVQAYVQYIQWPLWNFSWIYDEAVESMKSIDDIVDLLKKEPTVKDVHGAKNIRVSGGQVEFRDVSFNYSAKKSIKVFKKLSFVAKEGEAIAFVGPSGVGKSTIIKLIGRLYDPQEGVILVDGQNIKEFNQASYRKNLGVVSQQTVLFNDTIKNNIKYGSTNVSEEDIIKAAKDANIHDYIKSLPKGYQTLVGERGVKLSGGEAQRISIARAILKNPKILILDEATSSLDSQTEQLIQEALWRLIKGRTTFIIAHRLSTVMKSDKILVIDKGKITQSGTHQDLVNKKGIYAKLFEIQSGGYLK